MKSVGRELSTETLGGTVTCLVALMQALETVTEYVVATVGRTLMCEVVSPVLQE